MTSSALAHDFYDPYCCSNKDCKPVPCREIKAQENGAHKYQEYVFDKKMLKTAPDGMCHVCIWNNTSPRCLYLPAGS